MSEYVTWKVLCYVVPDYKNKAAEELDVVIAAAEERGRRAGIEERDELLRAALQSVEWVLPPQGETPAYCLSCGGAQPHHVPGCLIAAALAPRDSGKEDRK